MCYIKPARKKSVAAANRNNVESDVSKHNVLTIEFSSTNFKKKVLSGKKNNYAKLKASLFDDNCKHDIYINESFTSYFPALYSALKKYKKEEK